MRKLTRKQFVELAKKGAVEISDDFKYVAVRLNETNINMNDKFKEQLKNQGLYNDSYIGFLTSDEKAPYSMEWLPIYGGSKGYITKHFTSSLEDAVMDDLKDKSLNLLNRQYDYELNKN